jgi:hypothetical protein
MRIGIGLPAAVPEIDATVIGPWAVASEHAGFASLGVIDRQVYDNLDPLVALAAAAARTERVELLTTVLLPCSAELDQVGLLADAVSDSFKTTQNPFGTKDT